MLERIHGRLRMPSLSPLALAMVGFSLSFSSGMVNADEHTERVIAAEEARVEAKRAAMAQRAEVVMHRQRAQNVQVEAQMARTEAVRAAIEAEQAQAVVMRVANEEERRAVAESRRSLAEARQQLKEAARKVAEARRSNYEFFDTDGNHSYSYSFSTYDDEKPRLGVALGNTDDAGVKVIAVTPDGPAQKAGIEKGDVITSVNGHALNSDESSVRLREFFDELGELDEETAVSLTYVRDGESNNVSFKPEILEGFRVMPFAPDIDIDMDALTDGLSSAMPFVRAFSDGGANVQIHALHRMRGLRDFELTELDPALGSYFETDHGLLVLSVPDSMESQLQRGDVLMQIDGREPRDVGHAFRILGSYEPGESLELSILRKGDRQSVDIIIPEVDEDEDVIIHRERHRIPPHAPHPPRAPGTRIPTEPGPGAVKMETRVIKT